MRFLFVSAHHGSAWGGSEELWSQAAKRLKTEGCDVSASVQSWPEPVPQVLSLQEIGIRLATRPRRSYRRLQRLFSPFTGADQDYAWATRVLKSIAPALLILSCGGFAEDVWWLEAAAAHRVKYVVVAQAVSESMWPSDDDASRILRVYSQAESVFFVSDANRRLVETMLGTSLPNARIVRNPFKVDYSGTCQFPRNSTFHPACVARLEPAAKGQDLLLQLLASEKWRRRDVKISFYGSGPNRESLQRLAKHLNLQSALFPGFVSDISKVWSEHPLLVLPSRFEGLPLALVEAMLCARAAVVTGVSGNPEVIDESETGFIASSPTVSALDAALEKAWTLRDQLQSMGVEAARRIRLKIPSDPVATFCETLKEIAV